MRASRATLLVIVLLGALLRLAFLSQPMRLDETANYALVASRSLSTITSVYLSNNNHPLHTLLVHFVTSFLGSAPWCIRVPAFLAGVLVIPATYAVFAEVVDRPTGLLAAALVASSSPLTEYSTSARGYSLQALLVLVMFFASARVLRGGGRVAWAVTATASILGFYTIPTMAFFFASAILWMFASAALGDASVGVRRMTTQLLVLGAGVVTIVGLLYLSFIRGSGLADVVANRWVEPLSWPELRSRFWESLLVWVGGWHRGLPQPVAVVMGAGFVASLVVFRRLSRFRVNPVPVTLVTCLAMMTIRRLLPPERVWLPLVPLYLGSVAIGLRWVAGRVATALAKPLNGTVGPIVGMALSVLVAGIGSTLVLFSNAPYQTPDQVTFSDAEPLAIALGGILEGHDTVYLHTDAAYMLEYYLALHHVPTRYVYRPNRGAHALGRAFLIDASKEYPAFTYDSALRVSDLARSHPYEISVVLELPHARLLQVMNPVQASAAPSP